uniref:Uncharacterized protein n=1 Tax=Plectus sambesii TaxID=2011161 RepID=A0A914UZJ2_9BILA
MKAIVLTAYFAALFLGALGADQSIFSKWTDVISPSPINGIRIKRFASGATCDIQ